MKIWFWSNLDNFGMSLQELGNKMSQCQFKWIGSWISVWQLMAEV